MTVILPGVSSYPNLLPEGKDDSTSIVPVRQAIVVRGNAISADMVDLSSQRAHNQWSGKSNSYTQYRVRPYATIDDEDAAPRQYQLASAEVFSYYSGVSGTYGSAAAQYEFYARLFNAPYGRALDIFV